MIYRLLADITILIHLFFIVFVLFGGLLVFRRRWFLWLHIPAFIWGILIEGMNWICPLTPLENFFFRLSGKAGYAGGFIEHYLVPLIYPSTLSREMQWIFAIAVLLINAAVYIKLYLHIRNQ